MIVPTYETSSKEKELIISKLQQENQKLNEQLDYLRSGEYLNQLRFERDMLQHVVDNNEVSKEDKEFIDMTHRNTELLEENQELKKQYCERTDCSGRIGNSKKLERLEMENRNLRRAIKKLLNNEDIGTGLMNTLYGYGLFNEQDNN